jgi:carbon-monoxide dehydrogenase large subunit
MMITQVDDSHQTVGDASRGDHPAPMASRARRYIGESVTRLEDFPLLTGRACFVGDVSFSNQLHMRVVRSEVAHGRILSIDVAEALAAPGVVAVWTADDIAGLPPIPFRATKVQGLLPYRQPVLACGTVRYVGEPVAVIFADDAYRAEDAADLVVVDIDPLDPLVEVTDEPREFAPGHSTEPVVLHKEYGNIEQALAQSEHIIELELSIGRHSGIPMETRGALARYDQARDHLELYGAAKRPHWNRDQLAEMLDLPRRST